MFSKSFSFINIGDMNFDGGDTGSYDGIAHGHTRMGISRRIDHNSAELSWSLLDPIDQFTFIIRLANLHRDAQLLGQRANLSAYFFQSKPAINFRLAFAEQIQVRTVEEQDSFFFCHHAPVIVVAASPSFRYPMCRERQRFALRLIGGSKSYRWRCRRRT